MYGQLQTFAERDSEAAEIKRFMFQADQIANAVTELSKAANDMSVNSGEAAKGANDVSASISEVNRGAIDDNPEKPVSINSAINS